MTESSSALVPTEGSPHPEFRSRHITLDPEAAVEHVCERLKGCSATETGEGIKIRTMDGSLIAILEAADPETGGAILHYRTAPASETATLKATKVWRTLEPFAD